MELLLTYDLPVTFTNFLRGIFTEDTVSLMDHIDTVRYKNITIKIINKSVSNLIGTLIILQFIWKINMKLITNH